MTNAVLQAIMERRSIRSFESRQITKEELEAVVNAGIWAASGNNTQNWRITAIQNPEKLALVNQSIQNALKNIPVSSATNPYIAGLIRKAQEEQSPDFLFAAPAYILVSNVNGYDNAMADSSLAMGNMMLAAHSIGLGSCWLNLIPRFRELPEIRVLMDELEMPKAHLVYGTLALGYPATTPQAPPRREGTVKYF